jgi:hypothetical protein
VSMDIAKRVESLRNQLAVLESEMSSTLHDLPDDPKLAPEEVERYHDLEKRHKEIREELARIGSSAQMQQWPDHSSNPSTYFPVPATFRHRCRFGQSCCVQNIDCRAATTQ